MKLQPAAMALALAALTLSSAGAQQNPPQTAPPPAKQPMQQPAGNEPEKKAPRKRVVMDLSGFDLLGSGHETMVVGATRTLPHPLALAPQLGKMYGTSPTFAWSYGSEAGKFVFVLLDEAQQEFYRTEVAGTQLRYPKDAPALVPGKTYFWIVQVALGVLGSVQSAPAGFLVVSSSQREELEKVLAQIPPGDSYALALGRAHVFTRNRLWYDAVAAYSDLIARFPDRAELYEQRGMIYAQLESTRPLADQDFARADSLTAATP